MAGKKTKRIAAIISTFAMAAALMIGGTLAYMTSAETTVNTITIGKVKIGLEEPNYPGNDSEEVTNITPSEEIAKDPQVRNNGKNDAVIFAEAEIPIDEYVIADGDGKRNERALRELFWIKRSDAESADFSNTIHDGAGEWKWMKDLCYYKDASGNITDKAVSGGRAVHVFAYTTILEPGYVTVPIFDKVQLKNIVLESDEVLPSGDTLNIPITAYAIQGSLVYNNDHEDLTTNLTTDTLTQIFKTYCNQNEKILGAGNVHKDDQDEPSDPSDPSKPDDPSKPTDPETPDDPSTKTGYTIMFQGEGISTKAVKTSESGIITEFPDARRPGYSLKGWKTDSGDYVTEGTVFTQDAIVTAEWEIEEYFVRMNPNGGKISKAVDGWIDEWAVLNYTVESESFNLPVPQKDGSTFKGWKDRNGNINKNVTISKGTTGSKFYEAVWEEDVYSISYNLDGGTLTTENPATYTSDTDTFTLYEPEKTYFDFLGWSENDSGEITKSVTIKKGSSGDKIFTAHWKAQTFSISYDLDKGAILSGNNPSSYTVETDSFTLITPEKDGYIFAGWQDEDGNINETVTIEKGSHGDRSFTATWKAKESGTYSIEYDLAGGAFSDSDTAVTSYTKDTESFTLLTPSRNGYEFIGWTGSNGDTPETSVTVEKGSAGDKNYKANWKVITYTIELKATDGLVFNTEPKTTYTIEDIPFTIEMPSKEGYTFNGWGLYWKPNGPVAVLYGDFVMDSVMGNIELTPNMKPVSYNITYDLGGGSLAGETSNPDEYTIETDDITLNAPAKSGYTFIGWTGSSGTDPQTSVTIKKGSTGNKTYKANYKADSYKITYVLNGGSLPEGASNPASYSADTETFTLNNPVKAGYEFIGWALQNEDPTTEAVIYKGSSGDKTFTACWSPKEYSITYDLNGGSLPEGTGNPSTYTIETDTFTLNNPEKSGYVFAGWKEEGSESAAGSVTIRKGSVGDKTYTATWKSNVYALTFDLDGGHTAEGASLPTYYTQNGEDISITAIPEKDGYTFTGWTGSNGNIPATSITIKVGETGDKSYKANWNLIRYTVSYNLNGGSVTEKNPDSYTVEDNKIALSNPVKSGYTFAGWIELKDETRTNLGTAVTIAGGEIGNRTFEATWNATEYIIKYDLDGGNLNGKVNPATYTSETESFTLINPVKEGYTFAGWKNEDIGEIKSTVTISKGSSGNLSFVAQWTASAYKITYNLNGGTLTPGETNPETYTVESGDIVLNTPSRKFYTFAGWKKNGGAAEAEGKIESGSTGDVTFEAVWVPVVYKLTYSLNGGTLPNGKTNPSTFTVESDDITLVNPSKKGYTFNGWTSDWNGSDVIEPTIIIKKGSYKDRHYDAEFSAIQYSLTYNLDGGELPDGETNPSSYTVETETFTLIEPVKTGYSFNAWIENDGSVIQYPGIITKGSVGDHEFTAGWTPVKYTITYDLQGGTLAKENDKVYTIENSVTFNTPTREGYTFAGWKIDGEDGYQTGIAKGSTGNKTVTAIWSPVSYNIIYNLNGGSLEAGNTNPSSYTADTETFTLNNPVKDGYVFAGWITEEGDTPSATITIEKGATGNRTYTATWATGAYAITYDLDGGSIPGGASNPAAYTAETETFTLVNPERTGYEFTGWSGTGLLLKSDNVTVEIGSKGDRSYKANWKAVSYTITYDLDGGTVSKKNPSSYTVEDEITLNNPTRSGYTFLGWTEDGGTETKGSVTIAKGTTGNKTYKAVWEEETYTISYNYNGGELKTGVVNPGSYKTTEISTVKITFPYKNGYKLTKAIYAYSDKTKEIKASDYEKADGDLSGWSFTGLGENFYSDITVTFEWEQTPFIITYAAVSGTYDDGTSTNIIKVMNGEIVSGSYKVPAKEGYTLKHWFLNTDDAHTEIKLDENGLPTSGVTSNMTLCPVWEAVIYNINYNLDGGRFTENYKTGYHIASDNITLLTPVKTGYRFDGWTGSNGDTPETSVTITTGSTGDKSYKANWTKLYTVTIHNNNGTDDETMTVASGDSITEFPATPGKEGSAFNGWYTDKTLTEKLELPYVVTEDMDIYAGWTSESKTYTIMLMNLESGATSLQTDENGTLSSIDTPARDGYTFTGWYSDSSLTTKVSFPAAFSGDAVLYAGWEQNKKEDVEISLTGEHALYVKSYFVGDAAPMDMIYRLLPKDDATKQAVTDGLIVIESDTATVGQYAEAGTEHKTVFGTVTFKTTGTYTFAASLATIDSPDGWTFDTSEKEITVVVSKNGTTVSASVTGNGAVFTNSYNKPSVKVEFSGDNALKIKAAVTGSDAIEKFKFSITPADDETKAAVESGVVTLASTTAETSKILTAGETETIYLDTVTVTQSGSYRFKITEINENPADTKWYYANKASDAKIITVNVSISGNSYAASIGNQGPVFTNRYDDDTLTTPITLSGENALKVGCLVTGADSDDTFTFSLTPQNEAAVTGVADGTVIMETQTASTTAGISKGETVYVSFGSITFSKAGVYTFTAKETNTTVPTNWTYANKESDAKTITVTITQDLSTGKIKASMENTGCVFTNAYDTTKVSYVTPQMFGATENDSYDDTEAFNNALKGAASYGTDTVYVPAGSYYIDAGTGIKLRDNTKLKMADGAVLNVISNSLTGYNCIYAKDIDNAEVSGGTIVGDRKTHTGTSGEWGHGISLKTSTNIKISGVTIKNCWGDGIYIGQSNEKKADNTCQYITIENCTIDNNRRNGISITAGDDVTITGCVIVNTNGTSPEYGIDIETNHWKKGDYNSNDRITITSTTCAGNTQGSIGFPMSCNDVTVKDSVMSGTVANFLGHNVVFDNTSITAGSMMLYRGIDLKNGSTINQGTETADTLLYRLTMSDSLANVGKYNTDDNDTQNSPYVVWGKYSTSEEKNLSSGDTSAYGMCLYFYRAKASSKNLGVFFLNAGITGGKLSAFASGKTYRIELTCKGNATSVASATETNWNNPSSQWSNVNYKMLVGGEQTTQSFYSDADYGTVSYTFTSVGATTGFFAVCDISNVLNAGLFISDIAVYQVN